MSECDVNVLVVLFLNVAFIASTLQLCLIIHQNVSGSIFVINPPLYNIGNKNSTKNCTL